MFKIGLTGGIGSGKSTAADFFRAQGIEVIDLDQIARAVVQPGRPALKEICKRFGETILTADRALDRQKLGQIIFNHAAAKSWLEALLHPLIHHQTQNILAHSQSAYAVIEIPLLAENQRQGDVDRVLVIDCDKQLQIDRAMVRGRQTEERIRKIISLQACAASRKALADDIVENNGTGKQMEEQLSALHQKYLRLAGRS